MMWRRDGNRVSFLRGVCRYMTKVVTPSLTLTVHSVLLLVAWKELMSDYYKRIQIHCTIAVLFHTRLMCAMIQFMPCSPVTN
jgi:hypothetical protein